MRQTGVLAASAAYALTHNFLLLSGVHALAKRLQDGLENIGANILSRAETCMVSLLFFLLNSESMIM
jgi:threonine aldolase